MIHKQTLRKWVALFIMIVAGIYPVRFLAYNSHSLFTKQPWAFSFSHLFLNFPKDTRAYGFLIIYTIMYLTFLFWVFCIDSIRMKTTNGMRQLTPDIEIPNPAGNKEHGDAYFLQPKQYKKVFTKKKIPLSRLEYFLQMGKYDIPSYAIPQGKDFSDKQLDRLIDQLETNVLKIPALNPEGDPILEDFILFASGGLVVAQPDRKTLYTVDTDTHSLTIGATRSGKGRNIVMPTLCQLALAGASMVLVDLKGELYHFTHLFLKRLGYDVIVIDWENPEKSDYWNPLQVIIDYLRAGDTPAAIRETWELVEGLVGNRGESKTEPIWHNGECSIIACCIMAVLFDNQKRPSYQNPTNAYHFLHRMATARESGKPIPLIEYLRKLPDEHPAKSMAASSEVAPVNTRGSFFTSALTTLRLYSDTYIAHMSKKTNWDIYSVGEKKCAVFLILPEEKPAYFSLASLFISQQYQLLVRLAKERGGRLPRRTEIIFDETGNFPYIPAFDKIFTVGAGRGIRLHLFLQSFEQLDNIYGENISNTITSNCHTWIYLRADDAAVRKRICENLDGYTIMSPSASSSNDGKNVQTSYSYMRRDLLTTDEIKKIARPYQLVMADGTNSMMYSPDLSETIWNDMLGLGGKNYNTLLTYIRKKRRKNNAIKPPPVWKIWEQYYHAAERNTAQPKQHYTKGTDEDRSGLYFQ